MIDLIIAIGEALAALGRAVASNDDAAAHQAILTLNRKLSDEIARRELTP